MALPQSQGSLPRRNCPAERIALGAHATVAALGQLVQVADGLQVMRGQEPRDFLTTLTRLFLRPDRHLHVLVGPQGLRERLVSDVANQYVPERELELARECRRFSRNHDLFRSKSIDCQAPRPA